MRIAFSLDFFKEVGGETRSAGRILDVCVAVGLSRHGVCLRELRSDNSSSWGVVGR